MRHAAAWVVMWVACFWLFLLLAGDWNHIVWIAAASGATVAATVGEIARTASGIRVRIPLSWVAQAWSFVPMVFVDFAILVWALGASLVRRRVVRGELRVHDFPVGGTDPTATGVRFWANLVANYSPNSYVVDIDAKRKLTLVHYIVPFRKSSEPA